MAQRFTAGVNYASAVANLPNYNVDYTSMGRARIVASVAGTNAQLWRHAADVNNRDRVEFVHFGDGIRIAANFATAGSGVTIFSPLLSDGVVYHIATVRDATTVRLYIDAALSGSNTHDAAGRAASAEFAICKYDPGADANEIDCEGFKFFGFAMTQPEIAAAMAESWPTTPDADNLWPFVDGLGADGEDHRGDCDLTITGTLGDSGGDFQEWPPEGGGGGGGGFSAYMRGAGTACTGIPWWVEDPLTADRTLVLPKSTNPVRGLAAVAGEFQLDYRLSLLGFTYEYVAGAAGVGFDLYWRDNRGITADLHIHGVRSQAAGRFQGSVPFCNVFGPPGGGGFTLADPGYLHVVVTDTPPTSGKLLAWGTHDDEAGYVHNDESVP